MTRLNHKITTLSLSGIAVSAAALCAAPALAQSSEMSHLGIPLDRIGLVAYTIRDQIEEDAEGTLRAVTDCGIENIEFSGSDLEGSEPTFQGIEISQIQSYAEEMGFGVPSLGVSSDDLSQRLDAVIEAANTVDADFVRISGPRLTGNAEEDAATYEDLAAILSEAGSRLSEEGITVAYHNHGWEFEDLGNGTTPYQILLDNTEAGTVAFELDLYWTAVGGSDPATLVGENPDRFPLFHVKDGENTGADEDGWEFRAVGAGEIDFASFFDTLEDPAGAWYFIENDDPQPDGVTVACDSYEYMSSAEAPN